MRVYVLYMRVYVCICVVYAAKGDQEGGKGKQCPTYFQNNENFKFGEQKCVFVYSFGAGRHFLEFEWL